MIIRTAKGKQIKSLKFLTFWITEEIKKLYLKLFDNRFTEEMKNFKLAAFGKTEENLIKLKIHQSKKQCNGPKMVFYRNF